MLGTKIYEVPDNVQDIFKEVDKDGETSYRIIHYEDGMDMANFQSMQCFIDTVGIDDSYIDEYSGTQCILKHPNYTRRVVVDSGGLGDFYSHGYDC